MILIDLNQVLLSGLMAQIANQKGIKLEEGLVRHMILNIIRTHVKNFRHEYGEVVLCCDNRKYWRKEFFPFYKAGRKKAREKSDLDWHIIFEMLAKFKQELRENFPYKLIDVEGAEADDIIGTLTTRYAAHDKILILSSDGDFLQLQHFPSVKQYNPSQKKYVKTDNPTLYLKTHIIEGDKGDGIPNVLSPGDVFVREERQKPLTKSIKEKLLKENADEWQGVDLRINWARNAMLIDLANTPKDIKEKIINTYEETKPAPRSKLLNYFIKHKLKNLMDVIEEF